LQSDSAIEIREENTFRVTLEGRRIWHNRSRVTVKRNSKVFALYRNKSFAAAFLSSFSELSVPRPEKIRALLRCKSGMMPAALK